MNWSIIINFVICLGAYLLGLVIFVIIKAIINKKKLKKELSEHEKDSTKDN